MSQYAKLYDADDCRHLALRGDDWAIGGIWLRVWITIVYLRGP